MVAQQPRVLASLSIIFERLSDHLEWSRLAYDELPTRWAGISGRCCAIRTMRVLLRTFRAYQSAVSAPDSKAGPKQQSVRIIGWEFCADWGPPCYGVPLVTTTRSYELISALMGVLRKFQAGRLSRFASFSRMRSLIVSCPVMVNISLTPYEHFSLASFDATLIDCSQLIRRRRNTS